MWRTPLLVAPVLLLAACGAEAIDGSGTIVSESRSVGAFERIDASQGVSVRLVIDDTASPFVTVNYDDNVLDDVITDVSGNTLEVRLDTEVRLSGGGIRYVEVIVSELTHVDASNGASVAGTGSTPELEVTASGGASVALSQLETERVEVDLSGGASVTVRATDSVTGDASGGSSLSILGDPRTVDVATSGGASVTSR